MRIFSTVIVAFLSANLAHAATVATARNQRKEVPFSNFTISFDCNGNGIPNFSNWTIQGLAADSFNHAVVFSSTDPAMSNKQLFVIGDTVNLAIERRYRTDRPATMIEIGTFNKHAAVCQPDDEGQGYGKTFDGPVLNMTTAKGITLSLVAGTKKCEPGMFNSDTLNTLVVRYDGNKVSSNNRVYAGQRRFEIIPAECE